MRVAIFGGSFDPVHLGHLLAAEGCAEAVAVDQVLFVPAATSPLKPGGPVASDEQRLAMLQLALGGTAVAEPTANPASGRGAAMAVDRCEIARGGASYTIDTVVQLQQQRPGDEFFLLVGSDAFTAIRRWHQPAELLQRVLPVVYRRGGDPPVDWSVLEGMVTAERAEQIRSAAVRLRMLQLSSSEIRDRVAAGRSIRFLVPHAVEALIHAQALYRQP